MRVALALGVLALLGVGVTAPTAAAATGPKKLVRLVTPSENQLVRNGRVRLVVRTQNGARPAKVDVDGVNVTRLLRAGQKGTYSAQLRLGHGLHYGVNDAFVRASGKDRRGTFDHTRFIVAQRDDSLLKLTELRTDVPDTPARVSVRLAKGLSVRAYVNGQRVDRAFRREGKLLVGRLGANDGLHFGRNFVQILVHKTHSYRRRSTFDVESGIVNIDRDGPIAGAGEDRTITQNRFAKLDGRSTKLPPGSDKRVFSWKIASAPKGSKAKLHAPSNSRPGLVPDVPGRYKVRVRVRGKGKRARHGVASGIGAAADTSQTEAANDTTTITVPPDVPPAGLRLVTQTRDRSILLDGKPIAGRPPFNSVIFYAVLDRRTLERVAGGSAEANPSGLQDLGKTIDGYTGSADYLVVLNWFDLDYDDAPSLEQDRDQLDSVLQKIGAQKLTDSQRQQIGGLAAGSAVGVAGAPAGSAFVTFGELPDGDCDSGTCDELGTVGGMTGSLRLNTALGKYDFVFTDYVDIDTEANQTDSQFSPAEPTIKVGDKSFTRPNPGGGASGFHLLTLHAKTLEPLNESVYSTNAGGGGAEQPGEVQRLANDLKSSADLPERPLVVLQAFGAPHGNDYPWDQAAQQIERLGGTRQVFNAMNAVDPRPLNSESANRKGPYAFIGRVNATAPRAEQSYSLNGRPGRLRGVLMRARDNGFEPMLTPTASPGKGQSGVNTELLHLTNQAPQPFPAFKDTEGQPIDASSAQAVQNFLGGPEVAKLCLADDPGCDIRKSYYKKYGADWDSIQGDLANAEGHECPGVHQGFTADQCEGIRAQLYKEVSDVAKVRTYFGRLREAFEGGAGVAALADITNISNQITADVNPPPANNTASNALTMLAAVANNGVVLPPPANSVAAVFSASFAVAAYFTKDDGSPNLVGPKVTTAASKLGVELSDHYRQATNNLDDVGRLIVSDYGKLTTVASKSEADPNWQADNVGAAEQAFVRAARQTIYERLVPVAYPVLYDLGDSAVLDNARSWYCDGGFFGYDKHLFNEQSDGAQFVGRFPGRVQQSNTGDHRVNWNPLIAAATEHASDSLHSARIKGVPDSIVAKLFSNAPPEGIGLTKLEFFSPRNGFRFFPSEPTFEVRHDISGNWNGLNQRPYHLDGFAPDDSYIINCSDIPDPPNNAG